MMKALLIVPFLAACVAGADADDDLTLDETTAALTGDQIAAMNSAAAGTTIKYSMPAPQTLAQLFAPNPDLKRTVRVRRSDGNYVSEVIVPPDPLSGPTAAGPSLHIGPATTSWFPPDPCLPPDPCHTGFDVAGANLHVVGSAAEDQNGKFIVIWMRVTDATGAVVFESGAP
jgi:hypothetical protein